MNTSSDQRFTARQKKKDGQLQIFEAVLAVLHDESTIVHIC